MNRFGFDWAELYANTAKHVRIIVVPGHPKVREE